MKGIYLTDNEISEIMYSCESYSLRNKMEDLLYKKGIGIIDVKVESVPSPKITNYDLVRFQKEAIIGHEKYKFVVELYKRLVEEPKFEVYTYVSKWDKLKDFINDLNLPLVPKLRVNKILDKQYRLEEYILTPPTNDYTSVLKLVSYE